MPPCAPLSYASGPTTQWHTYILTFLLSFGVSLIAAVEPPGLRDVEITDAGAVVAELDVGHERVVLLFHPDCSLAIRAESRRRVVHDRLEVIRVAARCHIGLVDDTEVFFGAGRDVLINYHDVVVPISPALKHDRTSIEN